MIKKREKYFLDYKIFNIYYYIYKPIAIQLTKFVKNFVSLILDFSNCL